MIIIGFGLFPFCLFGLWLFSWMLKALFKVSIFLFSLWLLLGIFGCFGLLFLIL